MKYFVGDPHFSHKNITIFSRDRFKNVQEHDDYLEFLFNKWSLKLNKESDAELWVLGDWFNTDYLWVMQYFDCDTYFVYGNHDKAEDQKKFEKYFTKVYRYPLYISDKICVSHVPQAVFDDQINVYAHLHGNIIDKPNYISSCLEVNNYELLTEKKVLSLFSKMPKYNRRHLHAPYTEDEKVLIRPQNDLVLKPNGHIDLSAMRAIKFLEKQNKEC